MDAFDVHILCTLGQINKTIITSSMRNEMKSMYERISVEHVILINWKLKGNRGRNRSCKVFVGYSSKIWRLCVFSKQSEVHLHFFFPSLLLFKIFKIWLLGKSQQIIQKQTHLDHSIWKIKYGKMFKMVFLTL